MTQTLEGTKQRDGAETLEYDENRGDNCNEGSVV